MKKLLCLLFVISLVSYAPLVTFAEPAVEEEPPAAEVPTTNFTINIKYLDVDTNEEIAPAELLTGKLGDSAPLTIKKIDGYELSDVILTRELTFIEKDYDFPIHYVKLPQESQPEPSTSEEPEVPATTTPTSEEVETEPTEPINNKPKKKSQPRVTENTREATPTSSSSPTILAEVTETTTSSSDEVKVARKKKTAQPTTTSKKQTKNSEKLPSAGEKTTAYSQLIGFSILGTVLLYKRKH